MSKEDVNARLFGYSLFGQPTRQQMQCLLADKFLQPPFSVFNAQKGEWQRRKNAWIRLGIESELGRIGQVYTCNPYMNPDNNWQIKKSKNSMPCTSGISIFDPVLCEFLYRWFCPINGQIIDPFAGGSVRGIVAGCLDRKYWGCDLSERQIEANKKQAIDIRPNIMPEWVCGDSMKTLETAPEADFIFTCPPYGDLEKYSDDPNDLSTMEWHTFCAVYKQIILKSIQRLKIDRFACFVISNFRGPNGFYRDLVGETIRGFSDCQCYLYNDCILITVIGSAHLRANNCFETNKKLVKIHQNVLIFCKGDWKKAANETKTDII